MMRAAVSAVVVFVLALASAAESSAQLPAGPRAGEELGSVAVRLGLLAPQTKFQDDSFGESSFDNGMALGVSVATWPILGNRIGLRGSMIRSQTDGRNSTSEFAPIAVNDPNVYLYTGEIAVRQPMANGYPYVAVGYGGKHYTWKVSSHKVSRFATWTAATGSDLRPASLGMLGVNVELRGYRSNFRAFGIDDGTFEDGPLGGKVGGVKNLDLLFTTGFSVYF
jgi:hypothetical protein